jgi:hypothetical protein
VPILGEVTRTFLLPPLLLLLPLVLLFAVLLALGRRHEGLELPVHVDLRAAELLDGWYHSEVVAGAHGRRIGPSPGELLGRPPRPSSGFKTDSFCIFLYYKIDLSFCICRLLLPSSHDHNLPFLATHSFNLHQSTSLHQFPAFVPIIHDSSPSELSVQIAYRSLPRSPNCHPLPFSHLTHQKHNGKPENHIGFWLSSPKLL